MGILLADKKIRRIQASYVGENKEFERQYLTGELEVELTPQGSLAEKLRCGGSGIAGFYTLTGSGTQVAEGGLPLLHDADGKVVKTSPPKETKVFDVDGEPKTFVLEEAISCDFGLVRAWRGDRHGNLARGGRGEAHRAPHGPSRSHRRPAAEGGVSHGADA